MKGRRSTFKLQLPSSRSIKPSTSSKPLPPFMLFILSIAVYYIPAADETFVAMR